VFKINLGVMSVFVRVTISGFCGRKMCRVCYHRFYSFNMSSADRGGTSAGKQSIQSVAEVDDSPASVAFAGMAHSTAVAAARDRVAHPIGWRRR